MGLFQKPASTPEEVERGRPLPIPPEVVDTFDEDTWYSRAYRGDAVPQLTVRAVLMGSVLGFLLAISNVYIGLKAGWALPVALTACIVSFSLWSALLKIGLARTPMSILENNCMQSTASSAGATTSQIVITAAPALLLLGAEEHRNGHLPWPLLAAWIGFTALLGVVLAIPMKRNMINQDRLKFPSGIAAAVTLQSLYSHGGEAVRKGRALLYAASAAGVMPLLMDLNVRKSGPLLPSVSKVFDWLPARGGKGVVLSDWTVVLDHKLVMVAAGAIVGPRIAASMLIGALALAYWVGPAALAAGAVTVPSQAWLEIGLWVGAPMLLAGGLLSLAFGWRTLLRSLRGARGGSPRREADIPRVVFVVGLAVAGGAVVAISHFYFQTPWALAVFGVVLAFILGLAICRAAGESDIMPLGPMATLTQLVYGGLLPQNIPANIASPGTTVGAGAASGDLLNDLKSGHLLGASPRRQFVAQLLGIIPGTIAVVIGYSLLVPDVRALTGEGTTPAQFPAPYAHLWLTTAKLVTKGFGGLHPFAQLAVPLGALVGVALTLAERLPARLARWLPSPIGLGLGMVIPFQYPLSFFIGAVAAWWWSRRRPEQAERFTIPLASGAIAGESLVGVAVALINNFVLRR